MLQALEVMNGATLANTLHRGAKRMLGELPRPAENLFDSGACGQQGTDTMFQPRRNEPRDNPTE